MRGGFGPGRGRRLGPPPMGMRGMRYGPRPGCLGCFPWFVVMVTIGIMSGVAVLRRRRRAADTVDDHERSMAASSPPSGASCPSSVS